MALMEPVKNGGRYTKREQEERRLQVHHLHFEDNKSAVEIAETLNVNRNTINDDIKFWFRQIPNRTNILDIYSGMIEEIQRKKIQRDRLLDYLEEVDTINEKIRLENLIESIGNRLEQFFSKLIFSGKENLDSSIKSDDIEEEEIKNFVRYLILSYIDVELEKKYSEDSLKFEFIKKTKCNVAYADKVIKKMYEDGLSLCKKPIGRFDSNELIEFDIKKFASLRGHLSMKEYNIKKQERKISKKLEKQVTEF